MAISSFAQTARLASPSKKYDDDEREIRNLATQSWGTAAEKAQLAAQNAQTPSASAPSASELNASRRTLLGQMRKEAAKRGGLSGTVLEQARARAAELGVTSDQFRNTLSRENLGAPAAPAAAGDGGPAYSAADEAYAGMAGYEPKFPAATQTAGATAPSINSDLQRVRATEDVQMQRQYGSGLGTQAAVQSPDYELGSGSALRAAPRRLGSQSGDMRRAARRLRKQGYSRAAEKLAMGAEMARLGEGSTIKSEAQRGREAAQQLQQQDQMRQMQGLTQDLIGLRRGQIQRERERQGI